MAGVNALFTQEFYRIVHSRLEEGGIFCQWVQIYEISPETHRTILRSLPTVFPHFVAGDLARAGALWDAGRFDEATALLREAGELVPGDRDVGLALAERLAARGRWEAVAQWAGDQIRRGSWALRDEAFLYLGMACLSQGRAAGAEVAFRGAIAADPYAEGSYEQLAPLLKGQGRIEEARRCIDDGLRRNPYSRRLATLRGALYD